MALFGKYGTKIFLKSIMALGVSAVIVFGKDIEIELFRNVMVAVIVIWVLNEIIEGGIGNGR